MLAPFLWNHQGWYVYICVNTAWEWALDSAEVLEMVPRYYVFNRQIVKYFCIRD